MKVLVSVPNTGWLHKHVVFALMKMRSDPRYELRVILPTHKPFENNLHHIIRDWKRGSEDFWLSIDADNPPMKNPLDLVALDKDIIGLPTPVWHFTEEKPGERPIYWNGYDSVGDAYKEHELKDGLQKVDAIGTGCFLMARRVVEKMQGGIFLRTTYEDGRVEKGNDIAFCERATKAGFEIWCHYDYPCMHFHELELSEVSRAIQGMLDG